MGLIRILRMLVGLTAVLIVGGLLYLLWRLYACFYLNRSYPKWKTEPVQPSVPPDNYHAPAFFYDERTHEFFMKRDA